MHAILTNLKMYSHLPTSTTIICSKGTLLNNPDADVSSKPNEHVSPYCAEIFEIVQRDLCSGTYATSDNAAPFKVGLEGSKLEERGGGGNVASLIKSIDMPADFSGMTMDIIGYVHAHKAHEFKSACDSESGVHMGPMVYDSRADYDICTACGQCWKRNGECYENMGGAAGGGIAFNPDFDRLVPAATELEAIGESLTTAGAPSSNIDRNGVSDTVVTYVRKPSGGYGGGSRGKKHMKCSKKCPPIEQTSCGGRGERMQSLLDEDQLLDTQVGSETTGRGDVIRQVAKAPDVDMKDVIKVMRREAMNSCHVDGGKKQRKGGCGGKGARKRKGRGEEDEFMTEYLCDESTRRQVRSEDLLKFKHKDYQPPTTSTAPPSGTGEMTSTSPAIRDRDQEDYDSGDDTMERQFIVSHTRRLCPLRSQPASVYDAVLNFIIFLQHLFAMDKLRPASMIEDIREEMDKCSITPNEHTSNKDFRMVMARLGMNRMYCYIPQIKYRLTKVPPPRISDEEIDLVVYQFSITVKNWSKILRAWSELTVARTSGTVSLLSMLGKTNQYKRLAYTDDHDDPNDDHSSPSPFPDTNSNQDSNKKVARGSGSAPTLTNFMPGRPMKKPRTSLVRYTVLYDFFCTMNKTPGYVRMPQEEILQNYAKWYDIYYNILTPAYQNGLIPSREMWHQFLQSTEQGSVTSPPNNNPSEAETTILAPSKKPRKFTNKSELIYLANVSKMVLEAVAWTCQPTSRIEPGYDSSQCRGCCT